MYIIKNIKLPIDTDFKNISRLFSLISKIPEEDIFFVKLYKKSLDARNKNDINYICSFVVEVKNDKILKQKFAKNLDVYNEAKYVYEKINTSIRPIVVGFGPAGMFAALSLAKSGLKPIVIERGKDVDNRTKDVNEFFKTGILNENSNIQFGEGGAGTFSDGKLNTGVKDFRIREILNIFVFHGAHENILYDSKPHIGTDILVKIVKSIRNEIIYLGGEVLFEHKLEKINVKNSKLESIIVSSPVGTKKFNTSHLVLSIGHSARDTFEMLKNSNMKMEPKPFAVGVRIEHKQKFINESQYGKFSNIISKAADYKLHTHLSDGRGVFTFCMCPGGVVVNASSEQNALVTNGMSNSDRNGNNANSAVLVSVSVEDYYKGDVLDGVRFQREIEKKAYALGNGKPVCQTLGNYFDENNENKAKEVLPTVLPFPEFKDINKIFPKFINDSLKEGLISFDKKIRGFANEDSILTAPETRSSSPVRILRDEQGNSSIIGIFPSGEGAGYAGGIMSAAIDGLKTAEKIIKEIKNLSAK